MAKVLADEQKNIARLHAVPNALENVGRNSSISVRVNFL